MDLAELGPSPGDDFYERSESWGARRWPQLSPFKA